MLAPTRKPQEFGFKKGDSHLIVNDISETCKAFDFSGKKLWERPCLARGQYSDWEYRIPQSDTPPGLYKLGAVYKDYEHPDSVEVRTKLSFGWVTYDMIDLEGNEDGNGRAGICLHGGGSACGYPGCWEPYQRLYPTWGCVRMYNQDLRDLVLPLHQKGVVFVSVYQEG